MEWLRYTRALADWRTQTKNQQGADNVDRLPGTRIRLHPATRSFFHMFPIKICSDSRGFSPGVHSHELDLPRCLWFKKWFYPHLSADSDGCYPPPMPNFSLGRICRIRRRSARGLWGVPIQIANGFLVLSCVQGVEMGHLPLQSLEVRKKTTVA